MWMDDVVEELTRGAYDIHLPAPRCFCGAFPLDTDMHQDPVVHFAFLVSTCLITSARFVMVEHSCLLHVSE